MCRSLVAVIFLFPALAAAQQKTDLQQVLDRLDRIEQENKALADEVHALRAELAAPASLAIAPNLPCILTLANGAACILWTVEYPDRLPPGQSPTVKWPVLITVRPIEAGEELFYKYGDEYVKPYKVGQRATKPKWFPG